MWKACILSTRFYNALVGNYPVAIDGLQENFTLESSMFHSKNLYSSFLLLCPALLSCILRAQHQPFAIDNPIEVLIISFGQGISISASIALNLVIIWFGAELVDFLNHSHVLQRKISEGNRSKKKNQKNVLVIYKEGNIFIQTNLRSTSNST